MIKSSRNRVARVEKLEWKVLLTSVALILMQALSSTPKLRWILVVFHNREFVMRSAWKNTEVGCGRVCLRLEHTESPRARDESPALGGECETAGAGERAHGGN